MARLQEIFIDTRAMELYNRDGALAAFTPSISAGELVELVVQLCEGAPAFDSTTGAVTNPDARFAGTLAQGESVIDNNWNWYDPATLFEDLAADTAISTLKISGVTPRPIGTIRISSADLVNYCEAAAVEGGWELTLADANFAPAEFTPSAAYASGAVIRYIERPIIVSADNDSSGRDTGRFSGLLDAANPVYESLVEQAEEISSTRWEFTVYLDGRPVFKIRFDYDCLGSIAMNSSAEYIRSNAWAEADSRYILRADWTAADEYRFSTDNTDWHAVQTEADEYMSTRRPGGDWGPGMLLKRGSAATIEVTETTTLAPGAPATVTEAEGSTAQARKLIFGIPRGADGTGDMTRAVYDSDADGVVDQAETALNVGGKTAAEVAAAVDATANIPAAGVDGGFAPLSGGKIPSQYLNANASTHVVADIAARDALTPTQAGERAFVTDASADETVTSGAAEYIWTGSAWVKIAEEESLDLILDWGNLQNKPSAFPPATHGHAIADVSGLQTELDGKAGTAAATTTTAGLMSATDKTKLDGLDPDAEAMTDAERARLLPNDAEGGDLAICREGVDRGNGANTRLLVQPINSTGTVTDSAYGNAAPVALVNSGVTVNADGDMVFDGSNYIDLPAGCLPSDVLDTGKEWTMDVVFQYCIPDFIGDYMTLFGRGNSPFFYLMFNPSGEMLIGGGPNLGGGWVADIFHHLRLEQYFDGSAWKYTAFRNGAVVASGTWDTAAWRAAELAIGFELDTPSRRFVGTMKAFKISAGAVNRGEAFTPLALPWLPPVKAWEKISVANLREELGIPATSPLLLDYALSGASVQLKIEASATADFATIETLIDTGIDRTAARLWDATAGEWIAFPAAGVSTGARIAAMMDNIDATELKYLRYKWYAIEAVSYIVTSVGENVIDLSGTYTGSDGTWLNTDDTNAYGRGWLQTPWGENSWALGYLYEVTDPEPTIVHEALYVATGGADATDATWSTSGGADPIPTIIKTGGAPADFDSGWTGAMYPAAKI